MREGGRAERQATRHETCDKRQERARFREGVEGARSAAFGPHVWPMFGVRSSALFLLLLVACCAFLLCAFCHENTARTLARHILFLCVPWILDLGSRVAVAGLDRSWNDIYKYCTDCTQSWRFLIYKRHTEVPRARALSRIWAPALGTWLMADGVSCVSCLSSRSLFL